MDSKASGGGKKIEFSLTNSFWCFPNLFISFFVFLLIEFSDAKENLSKALFSKSFSLKEAFARIEKSFQHQIGSF